MEDLVKYIAEHLVDEPDAVSVELAERERQVVYELRVAADDTGKVIGKRGRVANALRQIVRAAAMKDHAKATVEIVS